jgi:anti-sigma regulatory factor (Ser/Thr protein kinase)
MYSGSNAMHIQGKTKTFLINNYHTSTESRIRILTEVRNAVGRGRLVTTISGEELTLIVDEAVTNAMEHGNRWDSEKKIFVAVWADDAKLHVTIEDQGEGFDYHNHKSEFVKGNVLSPRGRGISLMKKFCIPSWTKSGRVVDLTIPLFS